MANSVTNNNESLVSKADLDSLSELDKRLVAVNATLGKSLTLSSQFTAELSQASIPFKELQQVIDRYEKAQKQVNASIEESNKIHQDIEKVQQKVVESTTKQVKAIQDQTKAYQENSTVTQTNAITLRDISVKAYNEASNSIEKQRRELILLKSELKSIQAEQNRLDKYYGQSGQTNEKYIAQKLKLNQAEESQKISIKSLSDTIKYNQQIISTSIGSYDNLSAQYSRLKPIVNQMSDAETYNGHTKQQLVEHLRTLREEMSKYQKQTGVNTLDVGKYDIAVKDLTKTLSIIDPHIGMLLTKIQQISPLENGWIKVNNALTTSLNISAKAATVMQLAVLGLVVGGIYLAIKAFQEWFDEQRKLNMSFDQTYNVMSRAAESSSELRVSYETLQRQWVALGDDLNSKEKFIRDNKDALDSLNLGVRGVTDADNIFINNTESVLKALKLRTEATIYSQIATEKLKESAKKREEAENRTLNPTLYQTIQDYTNNWGNNALIFAQNLFGAGIAFRSVSDEASKAAGELRKESEDAEKEYNRAIDERIKKLKEALKVEVDAGIITNSEADKRINEAKKQADKEKKLIEDRAKAEAKAAEELAQIQIKSDADAQKKILENNKKSYDERMSAANEFEEQQAQSLIQARDYQMSELRKRYKDLNDIEFQQQAANQIAAIEGKLQAELTKLNDEGSKLREAIFKDYISKQIEAVNNRAAQEKLILDQGMQEELTKYSQMYALGQLSQKEYEKKKTETTKEYAKARFDAEISSLNDMLSVSGLTEEQIAEIRKKIQDAEVKYNKWVNDQKIKDDEKAAKIRLDIEKQLSEKRKELMQEVGNFIMTLFSAETERNLAKLDEQSKQNDDWREKELESIDRQKEQGLLQLDEEVEQGLLTKEQGKSRETKIEEQAEAQRKMIADQAKAREKDLEEQRKQILERQAKFEKAQAITSIAINTAQAIMRLWVSPGFPAATALSAVVAALGAVQIATVLARPIPKYKDGGEHNKDGFAIVGDGGRSELGVLPTGEMFKTPDTSTLAYLPKGTHIYPDYEKAVSELKYTPDNKQMIILENESQLKKMDEQTKVMEGVYKGQKRILRETILNRNNNNLKVKMFQ